MNTVQQAYNSTIENLTIEQETMTLVGRSLSVFISGGVIGRQKMETTVKGIMTVANLKLAIGKCASDYCLANAVMVAK